MKATAFFKNLFARISAYFGPQDAIAIAGWVATGVVGVLWALTGSLDFLLPASPFLVASAAMRSTDFRSVVEPILNEVFDGVYEQRDDEYQEYVKVKQGTPRAYHEEPVLYGLPAAPEVPDGEPVTFGQGGTFYIYRYNYLVFGLAFALTKVLVEDGDHIRIGKIFAEHLAQSMDETKELLCAQILNRAFNASYTFGDNVPLCSASHPLVAGTTSNLLANPAALSQTSVEQMLIQVRGAVDSIGKKIRLKPEKLVVPTQLEMQAEVVQKSVLRSGTMNNDINPVRSRLKLEPAVVSRLTSTTNWWIKTNVKRGFQLVMRRKLEKSMEGDFDTDSMKYKATERYIPGVTDWRDYWGTPGQ